LTRSKLKGFDIHLDTVDPKLLELEPQRRSLPSYDDIQISEVGDMIQQRIVDFHLSCTEFELYTDYRRPCLS
jgi:hypothetical protein